MVTDMAVVAAYLALVLAVGWRGRSGSPESYWVAERRYGRLFVAASLVATIFGASSTVGLIGLGYARGLTGAWWALVGGIALVPFGLLLAPRVRGLAVYTLPDILERAYGRGVSVAGAAVIAVAWCGVVAAQLVAGALLLEGVFGVAFRAAVALVAVVFVLYTFWGGQLSVVRTDAWQLGLFVAALAATLVLVGRSLDAPVASSVPPDFLDFPVSERFGWYQVLVYYPLIVGLPYLVGPDMYSRVLCARDERTARDAALLAALAVIPLSLLLAFLGLLIHARLPGLAAESALPVALSQLAPAGLRGLVVAGMLGTIMSSADTTLISAATILSLNVVSPLTGRGRKVGDSEADERRLRLTRLFVVMVGAAAWGIAAWEGGIIASLLLAYTVFVGGVVLPTLASFWRDRLGVTPRAAMASVVLGGATAVAGGAGDGALLRGLVGPRGTALLEATLGPQYGALLPLVVSGVVLVGVSRAWPRRDRRADGA